MTVEVDILLTLVGMVATAAGIWGAIRADIRGMRRDIERQEGRIDDAHKRLDEYLIGRQP